MSLPVEALELEVLRLPVADRERLLDRVIASLDADKARDKAWDALAAKRDSVPGKEGFYRKLGFRGLLTAMVIFENQADAIERGYLGE